MSTAHAAFYSDLIRTPHLVFGTRMADTWESDTCLSALSPASIRELKSIMLVKKFSARQVIFLEQDLLKQVFIVLSGDVRLSMQEMGGRRLTFQIARQGAVLGMDSVLYGGLSEWTAETLYSCQLGVICGEQFHRFAERHPELYRIASKELVGKLQNACSTLRIIALSSCMRRRLACQLLAWAERGSKTGDQTLFRLALSHAQIAEFIGAARETVTRGLIAFKQKGLIEIHGSMVRIPSTAALKNYVELGEPRSNVKTPSCGISNKIA